MSIPTFKPLQKFGKSAKNQNSKKSPFFQQIQASVEKEAPIKLETKTKRSDSLKVSKDKFIPVKNTKGFEVDPEVIAKLIKQKLETDTALEVLKKKLLYNKHLTPNLHGERNSSNERNALIDFEKKYKKLT